MPNYLNIYQSATKKGRFGGLQNDSVTPGGRHRSRQVTGDFGLRVEDLEDAEKVLTEVSYDPKIQELLFKRVPYQGGGGTAVALATVLGGNAPPLVFEDTADRDNTDKLLDEQGYKYVVPPAQQGQAATSSYPDNRPLSIPLPTEYNGKLRTLPRVKDWERYVLDPATYTIGDNLPRCPDGICYLRVERPFQLGDRDWAASYEEEIKITSSAEVPTIYKVRTAKNDSSVLYAYYDVPSKRGNVIPRFKIDITALDTDTDRPSVTAYSSFQFDYNRLAIRIKLSRHLDPNKETAVITIPSGTIRTLERPPFANLKTIIPITYSADAYSVAFGLNRSAYQGFAANDLVIVKKSAVPIEDEYGVSIDCFDIIAPAGPAVPPHSHQTTGGGLRGGGPAVLAGHSTIVAAAY